MQSLGLRPTLKLLRYLAQRRFISDAREFAVGDRVILRQKLDRSAPPILTRPLQPGKTIESHRGLIYHDDIIGRRVRDVISSKTTRSAKVGTDYRLHNVTLEEYVRLSRRLVTPIYPADANLIVNLMDLHPDTEEMSGDDRMEILEAGTGHGALTLYLSRAIHAANSGVTPHDLSNANDAVCGRRAIIHTADISEQFMTHAQTIVQGYRNGLYARNVDFHVGDVSETVRGLRGMRGDRPFLSRAFLDLPAADGHLATVADALRTDGTLVVFNPSITQIIDCASRIKNDRIPLDLENVVELGVNGGSAGREWDVRFTRPRSNSKQSQVESEVSEDPEGGIADTDVGTGQPALTCNQKWSLVCRPRVGERIVGGGFLGVWRKERDMRKRVT